MASNSLPDPSSSPASPTATAATATTAAGSAGSGNDAKAPFKVRAELMAPTRLTPKVQLLHYARALGTQVVAHESLLLVLACAKCYVAAGKHPPRVAVLGGGHVGCAVVLTLLANGYHADRLALSTRQPDRIPRCEALRAPSALPMFQLVPRYYDNARAARESDVLVLCTPPSQLKSVAMQIRHALAAAVAAGTPPLVVSALCGVTHETVSKACGSQAVVRVQPDVAEIAERWRQQQQQQQQAETPQLAPSTLVERSTAQDAQAERDRLPLALRLAARALAPSREDVRVLWEALAALCRRVLAQDTQDARRSAAAVLFGAQGAAAAVAALAGLPQQEEPPPRTADVPSWPAEWEHDLAELQSHLVERAVASG